VIYTLFCTCFSTDAEVLSQLKDEESNDSSEVIDIFLQPPCDDGKVSDQDSDKSDGEVEFNNNHLGCILLSAGCEVRRSSRDSTATTSICKQR